MDVGVFSTYLAAMASRLLLTLLALLAGLAAQLTPAQARSIAVDVEMGAVTAVAADQRQSGRHRAVNALRLFRDDACSESLAIAGHVLDVVVATVLTGIDRARE